MDWRMGSSSSPLLPSSGLLKAAKKFDKTAGCKLLPSEKAALDGLSFVHSPEAEALLNSLEAGFADAFCDGSVQACASGRRNEDGTTGNGSVWVTALHRWYDSIAMVI